MKAKKFGNRKRKCPGDDMSSIERPAHSATFARRTDPYREAILAACDRFEKAKEFAAQHGPVRILVKDFKPFSP